MKLIKLQDKFILVSDETIIDVRPHKGKWHLEKGSIINQFPTYLTDLSECKLIIAGIPELPSIDLSLLSEEDCKTIGWVDVEKLWLHFNRNHNNDTAMGKSQFLIAYEYITAQSLNDKMFSLEDMKNAFNEGWYCKSESKLYGKDTFIQSLQQTSWDVEVNENNQINKIL